MADEQISVAGCARSLRWTVPLTIGACFVLWLLDVKGLRDTPWWATTLLMPLGIVFVLGPLAWLRWEHRGAHSRRAWAALGLAIAWAVVSFLLVLVFVAAVVPD